MQKSVPRAALQLHGERFCLLLPVPYFLVKRSVKKVVKSASSAS